MDSINKRKYKRLRAEFHYFASRDEMAVFVISLIDEGRLDLVRWKGRLSRLDWADTRVLSRYIPSAGDRSVGKEKKKEELAAIVEAGKGREWLVVVRSPWLERKPKAGNNI